MISRRIFIGTAAASLAVPAVARARASLDPKFNPQYVRVRADLPARQIVVLRQASFLYWVEEQGKALRYGIGLGPAGQGVSGAAVVGVRKAWPRGGPTSMIEDDPRRGGTPPRQPDGPGTPLDAGAIYLFRDDGIACAAIHGTDASDPIGGATARGSFRMAHDHLADLARRIPVGTPVPLL